MAVIKNSQRHLILYSLFIHHTSALRTLHYLLIGLSSVANMDQPYEFKDESPLRLNYTSSGTAHGAGSPEQRRPDSARSMRSSGSQNPMLDIKNSRKRTEADLQMLANRIALLRVGFSICSLFLSVLIHWLYTQAEEERAKVKVLETKQRADDIQRYLLLHFRYFRCLKWLFQTETEE